MDFFHAFILGVVEGITEFLPISSTGHLILTNTLLNIPPTDFVKSFEIAIQLGAIASVVVLYFQDLFIRVEIMKRIAVAFLPTAVLGAFLYKAVRGMLGNTSVVLWSLLIGGALLIIFEFFHKERNDAVDDLISISYTQAFLIGIFQSMAMIPGVSRAAATILGGLLVGLKRRVIVQFSFLVAVPTMLAATGYDLVKNISQFSFQEIDVLFVGFIVSFLVALTSIKFLLDFIKRHTFVSFGIYRIVVALAFLLIIFPQL